MADKDKTTLREFIKQLEELSDGGRNDNLEVGLLTNDEEFRHLGWFGIDAYYPPEEIEEGNLQHPTRCVMIECYPY